MIIVDVEVVDDKYEIDPDAVKSLAQKHTLSRGSVRWTINCHLYP